MIYTTPVALIRQIDVIDEIGNVKKSETSREVFCKVNYVRTSEFYNATAVGLTPTAELLMKAVNYEGEQVVIFNGKRLSVIRVIPKDRTDIVIVIGEKNGNQG